MNISFPTPLRPLAFLICLTPFLAAAAFPTLYLKPVVLQQIHSPTTITHAPDGTGRLFICDQPGKIYIVQDGMLRPTPFLNIASSSNTPPNNGPGPVVSVGTGYNERGLLGMAFHPGFANPASPGYRRFYVNYNKPASAGDPDPPQAGDTVNCVTVIDEFQVSSGNPHIADPASQRRVLAFTQPQSNHNGGGLEFGPDGMLYIGSGDGGGSNDNGTGHTGREFSTSSCLGNGQDKTRYLGKLLRINPVDPDGAGPLTYSIPSDNPFFNDSTPGLRTEIYAYGLRNPWKFSFDMRPPNGTNRLFCGDVGQGRIEEINIIVSGGNYGWRYKEGLELPTFSSGASSDPMPHPGGTLIDPIAMYAHPGVTTSPPLPQLGLSVTGGFVYRGSAIPALQGKYVFGDYGSTGGASDGRAMGLEETSPGSGVFTLTQAIPLLGGNPIVGQRILCLGEDESGEIYIGLKANAGVLALDNGLPAGGIYKFVAAQSATTTVYPAKDNTIFSDAGAPLSDARGFLYAGRTGPNFTPYLRRALLSFDVAAIPEGSLVQSAQVKINLNKIGPSAGAGSVLALHRLNETWGEGTSRAELGTGAPATTGDATWTSRFHNTTAWSTAGGSFQATASATTNAALGMMTWGPTSQLISDVQGWVTNPASNAGWIVRGDEGADGSACRFDSKEEGQVLPALMLSYQSAPPPTYFEDWLVMHFPTNLIGQWVDPAGDPDGDAVPTLVEYAYGLDPLDYDHAGAVGFSIGVTATQGGGNDLTVTFRRDPEATDLTYRLQAGGTLIGWTTIAQSTSGAGAAGLNGGTVLTDVEIEDAGPIRLVTVHLHLPAEVGRQFVRMEIQRQP